MTLPKEDAQYHGMNTVLLQILDNANLLHDFSFMSKQNHQLEQFCPHLTHPFLIWRRAREIQILISHFDVLQVSPRVLGIFSSVLTTIVHVRNAILFGKSNLIARKDMPEYQSKKQSEMSQDWRQNEKVWHRS